MKQELLQEIAAHLARRLGIASEEVLRVAQEVLKGVKKITPQVGCEMSQILADLERAVQRRNGSPSPLQLPQLLAQSPRRAPNMRSVQASPKRRNIGGEVLEAYGSRDMQQRRPTATLAAGGGPTGGAIGDVKTLRSSRSVSRGANRRALKASRRSIPSPLNNQTDLSLRAQSPQIESARPFRVAAISPGKTAYLPRGGGGGAAAAAAAAHTEESRQLTVWDLMVLHDVKKHETEEKQRRARLAEERARLKRELKVQMDLARNRRDSEAKLAQLEDSRLATRAKQLYQQEVTQQRDRKLKLQKDQSADRDAWLDLKREKGEIQQKAYKLEAKDVQEKINAFQAAERSRREAQQQQQLGLQAVLRTQMLKCNLKRRSLEALEREQFMRQSRYLTDYYDRRDVLKKQHLEEIERSTRKLERYFKDGDHSQTFSLAQQQQNSSFQSRKEVEIQQLSKQRLRVEELHKCSQQQQRKDLQDFLKAQISQKQKERQMQQVEFVREQQARLEREERLQLELSEEKSKMKAQQSEMGAYLSTQISEKARKTKEDTLFLNPREQGYNMGLLREMGLGA